jgi:hypothetical protein
MPHVALARCTFNQSAACALEFHFIKDRFAAGDSGTGSMSEGGAMNSITVIQPPEGGTDKDCHAPLPAGAKVPKDDGKKEKSDCTLQMATRIPPGIGSLAHDSSLRANPHKYFFATYLGVTPEHVAETEKAGVSPEDRSFLIRAPILQTQKPLITKNWVQVRVVGFDLFEPGPLLPIDIDGDGEPDGPGKASDSTLFSGWRRRTSTLDELDATDTTGTGTGTGEMAATTGGAAALSGRRPLALNSGRRFHKMMNHDHRPDLGAGAGWRAATQGSRRLEEYEYDEEYDESYAYEKEKNNVRRDCVSLCGGFRSCEISGDGSQAGEL